MTELNGKTVLVTGAGRGLGRDIAMEFAARGASVCVNYANSAAAASEVVAEIEASGGKAIACKADIANPAEITAMVDSIGQEFGDVDILVNNAGLSVDGPFMEMAEADWDAVLSVNLKGPFLTSQAVAGNMLKRKSGVIINVSANTSIVGRPNAANYCASKAGLNMLTKFMALELSPFVRVNGIGLGFVDSPLVQELYSDEQLRAVVESTPLKRMASYQEVAKFALLLASESTAFVTGQTIMFDGGRNMR